MNTITTEQLQMATWFAQAKDKQERLNPTSRDNARGDHDDRIHREATGKVAEFGVAALIGGTVNTTVYPKNAFIYNGVAGDIHNAIKLGCFKKHVHVKSCAFGMNAWLVERNDPIIKNPTKNDIVFFCESDIKGNYRILGYTTAYKIQNCYGSPRRDDLYYKRGLEWDIVEYYCTKI